jgi:hypothetical protein
MKNEQLHICCCVWRLHVVPDGLHAEIFYLAFEQIGLHWHRAQIKYSPLLQQFRFPGECRRPGFRKGWQLISLHELPQPRFSLAPHAGNGASFSRIGNVPRPVFITKVTQKCSNDVGMHTNETYG